MALNDILFPDGDPQNFIMFMQRGNGGIVSDIETESGSNSGMLLSEWSMLVVTSGYTWVS